MAKPQVQVEGAKEVRATLRKLGKGTRDMTAVHRKVVGLVIPAAASRTRHKSGALAGSYRPKVSAAKAQVSSSLVYAPIQEFGWPRHGITPSHALEATVTDLAPTIRDLYSREVSDLVARLQANG